MWFPSTRTTGLSPCLKSIPSEGVPLFLFTVSEKGMVKRTPLEQYDASRSTGIIGAGVANGDRIVAAYVSPGNGDMVVATEKGQAIRFSEATVSSSGRSAKGVRGIGLDRGDHVVSALHVRPYPEGERDRRTILAITRDGKFKRTAIGEVPLQLRAGKGGRIIVKKKSRPHKLWGVLLLENDRERLVVSQREGECLHAEARSIPLGAGSGSGYAVDDVTLAIQRVVVEIPEEGDEELMDEDTRPDWSEDGEPLMGESENSAQVELSLGSTDTDPDEG